MVVVQTYPQPIVILQEIFQVIDQEGFLEGLLEKLVLYLLQIVILQGVFQLLIQEGFLVLTLALLVEA
jgi:hypothetical protein